jgi:hypothetical protein
MQQNRLSNQTGTNLESRQLLAASVFRPNSASPIETVTYDSETGALSLSYDTTSFTQAQLNNFVKTDSISFGGGESFRFSGARAVRTGTGTIRRNIGPNQGRADNVLLRLFDDAGGRDQISSVRLNRAGNRAAAQPAATRAPATQAPATQQRSRPASSSNTFLEEDGLIVIEAESTQSNLGRPGSGWLEQSDLPNFTGESYLRFDGNTPVNGPPTQPLEYKFRVQESGLYNLHIHAARDTTNGQPRDQSNDAFVRVEGDFDQGPGPTSSDGDNAPLSALQTDTKFFGGAPDRFAWAAGARLDLGGHENKREAVYDFKAGEEYTLVVSGRSRFFNIDRIVFRRSDVAASTAQNLDLAESARV